MSNKLIVVYKENKFIWNLVPVIEIRPSSCMVVVQPRIVPPGYCIAIVRGEISRVRIFFRDEN